MLTSGIEKGAKFTGNGRMEKKSTNGGCSDTFQCFCFTSAFCMSELFFLQHVAEGHGFMNSE